MRRAARRDESESPIVIALQLLGWVVFKVNAKDGPDAFLSRAGRTVAAEIKTGKQPLRPGQERWRQSWQGEHAVLRSVQDALDLSGVEPIQTVNCSGD